MNAVEEKVVQFMIFNLKQFGPMHCEELLNRLKESPLDIKDFFAGCSSAYVECFFKRHKYEFSARDDGFISLPLTTDSNNGLQVSYKPIPLEVNHADVRVVECITELLHYAGSVKYQNIVNSLRRNCPAFDHYFNSYSPFSLFRFFKERSKFRVKQHGFVILAETVNVSNPMPYLDFNDQMSKVVEFFISNLKFEGPMHYTNLMKLLRKSHSDISKFFTGCSKLGIIDFFMSLPETFVIDRFYTVFPAESIKDPEMQSIFETSIDSEEKLINIMTDHLRAIKNLPTYYGKLCLVSNSTKRFFQKFCPSKNYAFFKERSQYFEIGSDGYVRLPGGTAGSYVFCETKNVQASLEKVTYLPKEIEKSPGNVINLPKKIEQSLEEAFIDVIRRKSQNCKRKVNYNTLKSAAIASNQNLKTVLQELSQEDIYQFLCARPQYFCWKTDRHVLLRAQFLNSGTTHNIPKNETFQVIPTTVITSSPSDFTSSLHCSSVNVQKCVIKPQVQVAEEDKMTLRYDNSTRDIESTPLTASTSSQKCMVVLESSNTDDAMQEIKPHHTLRMAKDSRINASVKEETCVDRMEEDYTFSYKSGIKLVTSLSVNSNVYVVNQDNGGESQSNLCIGPSSSICKMPENASPMKDQNLGKCAEKNLVKNVIFDANEPSSEHISTLSSPGETTPSSDNQNHKPESILNMDCNQNLPDEVQNKVAHYFMSVLTSHQGPGSKLHYQELVKYINYAPDDIKCVFAHFMPDDVLLFFSKSKQFSVDDDGSVSIMPEVIQDAEIEVADYFKNRICHSLQPCHYETLFCALQDSEIYKKPSVSLVFSNYMPNKCKVFFEKYQDCFSVDENGFVKLRPEAELTQEMNISLSAGHTEKDTYAYTSNKDISHPSDRLENETEAEFVFVFRLTDLHITAVRYFIDILKVRKSVHYEELLKMVCSDDQHMSEFFSNFTSTDVLRFFKIHSLYFCWDSEGIITLKSEKVLASKALSSYQEIMDVIQRIEIEAVKFYISILKDKEKASIFELECFLGTAPGYIISHFSVNYFGTALQDFFLSYSDYFDVNDKLVTLTSKALKEKFVSLIDRT